MNPIYTKDGYYEAILQLRPLDKKVLDYVYSQIIKNNVAIAKEVELKEGFDLYISSSKFAIMLGKKLKKRFPGTVKTSRTLFTQNKLTSKRVYRVTVCFRLKQ